MIGIKRRGTSCVNARCLSSDWRECVCMGWGCSVGGDVEARMSVSGLQGGGALCHHSLKTQSNLVICF